jgi:putative methyltransferase (TIGR04325 family)
MGVIEISERVARSAWRMPVLGRLLELDYERMFAKRPKNRYHGNHSTFDEARRAIPPNHLVGYDHPLMAGQYRDRMDKACESDYGVLFWLRSILGSTSYVFDFGGHVGVSFHGWRRYLDYPKGMRWCVYDLPAITRVGEELARERPSEGLSFTNDLASAHGADIFLTAGALQYVEEDLGSILRNCGELPRHLIVNKLPLHDGDTFVTIQSTGRAYHPYRISNRREFVDQVTSLGYRVVDDWMNREQYCSIPFANTNIEAYSGYYFTR